jgi:hypothetical protein
VKGKKEGKRDRVRGGGEEEGWKIEDQGSEEKNGEGEREGGKGENEGRKGRRERGKREGKWRKGERGTGKVGKGKGERFMGRKCESCTSLQYKQSVNRLNLLRKVAIVIG